MLFGNLAAILRLGKVRFLFQGDKARMLEASQPLLRHMESGISLRDHDRMVAERHSHILSLYACIIIDTMEF